MSAWNTMNRRPETFDLVLAEIEYESRGKAVTERVVCRINEDDNLETETGDDLGWPSEVIARWIPCPTPEA